MAANHRRTTLRIVTAALSTALFATPSEAQLGALVQLPGQDACWSQDGSPSCTDGVGLSRTTGVVVSPDGLNVYTCGDEVVASFSRDQTTGALTQLSGLAACNGYPSACATGDHIHASDSIEISPDGRFVYVTSFNYSKVAVLKRNTTTGILSQPNNTARCIDEGSPQCALGRSLNTARGMAIAADGLHLYVAAEGDDSIGIFNRDLTTGGLSQAAGTTGCIRDGGGDSCATGRSMNDPADVAVSRDGKSVYATSESNDSVVVFARDVATGGLTQAAGPEGCFNLTGASTCTTAAGLNGARGLAVSRDGRNVYVASKVDGAVTSFSRDRKTGELTFAECIREGGGAPCTAGTKLAGAQSVRVTRDGKTVYVVSDEGHSIAVFSRDRRTGTLTQLDGLEACVSADASGPCRLGRAITYPGAVALEKRGRSVYVPSWGADAVAVFERLRR